jgi:hypothetical protein
MSLRKPLETPQPPNRRFVNRHDELEIVRKKLRIGYQGKPMPSVVTCFWGAYGIGKSWLTRQLESEPLEIDQTGRTYSHPCITVRIDLSKDKNPALWGEDGLNRELFIRELMRQLAEKDPLGGTLPGPESISPEEWAGRCIIQLTQRAAHNITPLILLDTVDDLVKHDRPAFKWIELNIVERLALTDRVLFVFTSRGELVQWERWQVRRRVDSHRLKAFNEEHAGKEVNATPEISRFLYQHAFGHPLFTEFLGSLLEDKGGKVEKIGPDLVRTELEPVVDEILSTLSDPAIEKIARHTCVLRWISVEPLKDLCEALHLQPAGQPDADYQNLLDELQKHHLIYWNSAKNVLEADSVLRKLLSYDLELMSPEQFAQAHLAAYHFHESHLNNLPQYLERYIPEMAFHRANLLRFPMAKKGLPKLTAWWSSFLERGPTIPEPWQELADAWLMDEELKAILPKADYDLILKETYKQSQSWSS